MPDHAADMTDVPPGFVPSLSVKASLTLVLPADEYGKRYRTRGREKFKK